MFLFAVITEGLGVKNWMTFDPQLSREKSNSPENYALFFFIATMITFGTGTLQWFFRQVSKKYPLPTTTFIDLLTVCNLSLLMFDDYWHGYYLHGKSPYGMAEINAHKLRQNMHNESRGKAQYRGIAHTEPEL